MMRERRDGGFDGFAGLEFKKGVEMGYRSHLPASPDFSPSCVNVAEPQ